MCVVCPTWCISLFSSLLPYRVLPSFSPTSPFHSFLQSSSYLFIILRNCHFSLSIFLILTPSSLPWYTHPPQLYSGHAPAEEIKKSQQKPQPAIEKHSPMKQNKQQMRINQPRWGEDDLTFSRTISQEGHFFWPHSFQLIKNSPTYVY